MYHRTHFTERHYRNINLDALKHLTSYSQFLIDADGPTTDVKSGPGQHVLLVRDNSNTINPNVNKVLDWMVRAITATTCV